MATQGQGSGFDEAGYLRKVIGRHADAGTEPDEFERYGLNPGECDGDLIRQRLQEVFTCWGNTQRKTSGARQVLVKKLIGQHGKMQASLLNTDQRQRLAAEVRERGDRRRREAETRFDRAQVQVDRLTPSRRTYLVELGAELGLEPGWVAARLAAMPAPLESAGISETVRGEIRGRLGALATSRKNPKIGLSLYHFLDFDRPVYDQAELRRAKDQAEAKNGVLKYDEERTHAGRLLSFVETLLLKSDGSAYLAALRDDEKGRLRLDAKVMASDGRLDAAETKELIDRAREHGLDNEQARIVVRELAQEVPASVEFGELGDYVTCAACQHPHDRSERRSIPDHCTKCGQPLFSACPKCRTRNPASDHACGVCGFRLGEAREAARLLSACEASLARGHVADAQELIRQALQIAERPERAVAVEHEVTAALAKAQELWADVGRHLGRHELYSAHRLLSELMRDAGDVAAADGHTTAEASERLAPRLEEVRRALERARMAIGTTRERLFASVLESAADCEEAKSELARIPPQPPAEVRVSERGTGLRVRWAPSPSPGPVTYRLTPRPRNGSARSEVDLVNGRLEWDDADLPGGLLIRYEVVAMRAGSASPPAGSADALVIRDIESPTVQGRDGEVVLGWRPLAGSGRLLVERTDEEGHTNRLVASPQGAVDRSVSNGKRYRYRIWVEYPDGERGARRTQGATLEAVPVGRPQPIQTLSARLAAGRVDLTWTAPPSVSVSVYRSPSMPAVRLGSDLSDEGLRSLVVSIPVSGDHARDANPPDGVCWYLPVASQGGYRIVGKPLRYLHMAPIQDVRLHDFGSVVRVTWAWPASVTEAVVIARNDRLPVTTEDDVLFEQFTTLAGYRDRGGVDIPVPATTSVYVAVFPAGTSEGRRVVGTTIGESSTCVLTRGGVTPLAYSVSLTGVFRRRLRVHISGSGIATPELVLVARRGDLLPRSPSDGVAVATVAAGSTDCEVDVGNLDLPVAIRLFISDQQLRSRFRLADPPTSALVLR